MDMTPVVDGFINSSALLVRITDDSITIEKRNDNYINLPYAFFNPVNRTIVDGSIYIIPIKISHSGELLSPDPLVPNTFGWRAWYWEPGRKKLMSPFRLTVWDTHELRAPVWRDQSLGNVYSDRPQVRGEVGIHARLVPENWMAAHFADVEHPARVVNEKGETRHMTTIVLGIVERFQRFQLGTEGWRAEWVFIRKLLAPNEELGLELEKAYPEVEVIYGHR